MTEWTHVYNSQTLGVGVMTRSEEILEEILRAPYGTERCPTCRRGYQRDTVHDVLWSWAGEFTSDSEGAIRDVKAAMLNAIMKYVAGFPAESIDNPTDKPL